MIELSRTLLVWVGVCLGSIGCVNKSEEPSEEQKQVLIEQAVIERVKDDQLKKCLIKYQEDGDSTKIDAVQSGGCTLLQMAASSGELEALKALLKAGANSNAEGRDKRAPLNVAALDPAIIQALIDSGADVNHQDRDGNTPLHGLIGRLGISVHVHDVVQAIQVGQVAEEQAVEQAVAGRQAIQPLVRHSTIDINLRDNSGQTPLACLMGYFTELSQTHLCNLITQLAIDNPRYITGDPSQMAEEIFSNSDPINCISEHPAIHNDSVKKVLSFSVGYSWYRKEIIDYMQRHGATP